MVGDQQDDKVYDVIIVGAGPAGLVAGYVLSQSGRSILIMDKGLPPSERSEENHEDISSGVGGAGLYSDGKLSFHPSASKLWSLKPDDQLEKAYGHVVDLLQAQGLDIQNWDPKWSDYISNGVEVPDSIEVKDNRKRYESIYIDMKQRAAFISYIVNEIGFECFKTNSEVIGIRKDNKIYEVTIKNNSSRYLSRSILYAAGRYGAMHFDSLFEKANDIKKHFLKYEVGVRVESDSVCFKPYHDEQTDYKYIENLNNRLEVRSFCCCRDGKVVQSQFHNTISFNGSGDIEDSNRSNIGMNLRILSPDIDPLILKEVKEVIDGRKEAFKVPISIFMRAKTDFLGPKVDQLLKEKIKTVLGTDDNGNGTIYGPSVEGVGYYPALTNNGIKIPDEHIWIPGDCSGLFRGLMAALVSGAYAGLDIIETLNSSEEDLYKKLNIKISPTQHMKMIFTAQSKAFFYCRDAICEYVLKQGMLPINPFRIFDYFLSDRVDRNLIRQGNNQLIQSCEELWVFGPIADGVLFEIAIAKEKKMPIKFFHISTHANEIRSMKIEDVVFEPEIHARQIKKTDLISFLKSDYNFRNSLKIEQLEFFLGDIK